MADSTDDDARMRRTTIGTAKGDSVTGVAEDRADFIRAVTAGLDDLENSRDVPFDDAVIRLGLDRKELPS